MANRPLVIAGIDEAGYGPRLGPLCVAMASLVDHAPDRSADGSVCRDLWAALRPVVGRAGAKRDRPLVVDDSKALVGPRNRADVAVLRRLEPPLLAFLASDAPPPPDAAALLEALGAAPDDTAPWRPRRELDVPLTTTTEHIRCLASPLRARLRAARLESPRLECRMLTERDFNARCEALSSKAEVNLERIGALLRGLAGRLDSRDALVFVDRQSGRTRYGRFLARTFDSGVVDVLKEERDASEYLVRSAQPRGGAFRMRVRFEVDADAKRFPVALASMTAKYVREIAMIRFNRYWCARAPGLRPTAGYGADARRWLDDVAAVVTAAEREALVRRA